MTLSAKKVGDSCDVDLARLEERAALRLEAEGLVGLVVGAAAGDAGREQVGVRQEVGHHETAVAVADDADALGIGDADLDGLGDGGLGVGDELGHEGVVGGLGVADHRHGGPVEHRVALQEEEEVAEAP